ncbi:bromodomain and WD repeat-containing protein 3-like protein, partial [Leptotrombidium deliense]
MECNEQRRGEEKITHELLFLMWKWLGSLRLEKTASAIIEDVENRGLLPTRIDWQGKEHRMTFEEYQQRHPHIKDDHILKICTRFTEVLDKENPPSVTGVYSLLGAGSQSLLRQNCNVKRLIGSNSINARINGAPLLPSVKCVACPTPSLVHTLSSREANGPCNIKHILSTDIYAKQQMHKRQLGHLSSVY